MQIQFNNNTYGAVINLNVIRKFSATKGYKTVNEFAKSFENVNSDDISFENIDDFAMLFLLAFHEAGRMSKTACDLTIDDVYNILQTDQQSLMNMLTDSLSSGEAENPQKPGAIPNP